MGGGQVFARLCPATPIYPSLPLSFDRTILASSPNPMTSHTNRALGSVLAAAVIVGVVVVFVMVTRTSVEVAEDVQEEMVHEVLEELMENVEGTNKSRSSSSLQQNIKKTYVINHNNTYYQ